jgi:hypothetical protein
MLTYADACCAAGVALPHFVYCKDDWKLKVTNALYICGDVCCMYMLTYAILEAQGAACCFLTYAVRSC